MIQPNMSPKDIVRIWPEAEKIFMDFQIQITHQTLQDLVQEHTLQTLLKTLNETIGSSQQT